MKRPRNPQRGPRPSAPELHLASAVRRSPLPAALVLLLGCASATPPAEAPPAPSPDVAIRTTDRRVEYEGARLVSESRDVDGDGREDSVSHFGSGGELVRVEEDLDRDGWFETQSRFENGQLVEQQTDSDRDGSPDRWAFFENGQLVRHELDRNGDGFRDLVLYYAGGALVREELDRDGDGRIDQVTWFRDGRMDRRRVDVDLDGSLDVERSYGQNGRVEERKLSAAQEPAP